jgi:IS5 family transposase
MNRCHLKGPDGDAVYAVLCAAGYNIRWLLRMIVKKGISLFLRLLQVTGLAEFARALRQILMSNQLKSSAMHWAHA